MSHRMGSVALSLLWLLLSCQKGSTEPTAFLNPLLVKGGQRPSTPALTSSTYDPLLKALCVRWSPSIDPDTDREVPTYRLYLYFVFPPTEFFRRQDLLDEVVGREYCFETDTYTGMLTFVVTGYDGLAESLPSEPWMVSIP